MPRPRQNSRPHQKLTLDSRERTTTSFCLRKQSPINYNLALDHYNEAIKLDPKLAEAYEYRGVLFMEMNRKADAEKDLAKLKQLNPKLASELAAAIKTGREAEY
jgi:tetratricopeptide (TPR) repeat protein